MISEPRVRAALDAVAGHFAARWEDGGGCCDAWLTNSARRIALDVSSPGRAGEDGLPPRLRFDKVAARLIGQLEAACAESVASGATAVVSVTAPILLPSKTGDALVQRIRTDAGREYAGAVHGNGVSILYLRHGLERAPKGIAFVHNPGTDPRVLFRLTRELLHLAHECSKKKCPEPAAERWLVLTGGGGKALGDALRRLRSRLCPVLPYRRIIMVSARR